MIDFEKKIIFIHPPKTGGTTIESSFKWHPKYYPSLEGKAEYKKFFIRFKHAHLDEQINYVETLGYKENSFFKFACIRNPWDLMVSLYFFDKYHKYPIADNSFEEYVVGRFNRGPNFLDLLPMFFYHKNEFKIDYVIRYEQYKTDTEAVFIRYGVSWGDNFHVHIRPKNTPYQEVNTEVTKDLIYKKAKDVIDYFKYEF